MHFKIVRNLTDHLKDAGQTMPFLEMVELRQRLFREHKSTLLVLDAFDLISDHVLLYSGRDGQLMGYIRSIPQSRCARYEVEFPIFSLLKASPEYARALQQFRSGAGDPMHMGYLCLDPKYRDELRGMKAIDLMVWIGFMVSGVSVAQAGFAATLNNRYKQDVSMRLLGEWIPDLPDFDHPVVADKHRVVLVPRIAPEYWKSQFAKFKAAYGELGDGTVDLLRDESKIAA